MIEEFLRRGLRELGLPEDAAPAMAVHGRMLEERNRVMNLTAIHGEAETASLHFLDSAALAARFDFAGQSVVDVGSGAGFPGLPLRLVEPSMRLTLLDAQRKRTDFLREVRAALELSDVSIVQGRAEECAKDRREAFDIAVSRAVAALPVLAELCLPLVRPGGYMLAMKSVNSDAELSGAERALSRLGGVWDRTEEYAVPGADVRHRLIVIRKTGHTPAAYPRPWAKIKKAPL